MVFKKSLNFHFTSWNINLLLSTGPNFESITIDKEWLWLEQFIQSLIYRKPFFFSVLTGDYVHFGTKLVGYQDANRILP